MIIWIYDQSPGIVLLGQGWGTCGLKAAYGLVNHQVRPSTAFDISATAVVADKEKLLVATVGIKGFPNRQASHTITMVQPNSIISRVEALGSGARLLWYLLLLLASSSRCSSQEYRRIHLSRIADSIQNLTDSVRAQEQTSQKLASGLLKMFGFLTSAYLPCDEGWLELGASCYFLGVDTSTWQESREKCIALDSDLVKVTTDEEYNFLRNFVKGHETWVGLTDLHVEGIHVWTDGTVHKMIKSWWGDEEPNSSEERCIHYFSLPDNRWNDKRCTSKLRYICEKSVYPIDG
ncbi:CD209 antigen-like protein C [Palaemon carinicauda]|uniref:CD209 antigen-like protein C n=1 Tax=Palaemon carinicauda TaxID=392227 RepID=UPI0035B68EAD